MKDKQLIVEAINKHIHTPATLDSVLIDSEAQDWPVMVMDGNPESTIPVISERLKDRFEFMFNTYTRVLVTRFDLHFPRSWRANARTENKLISAFMKAMKHNALKEYKKAQFLWVRETEKAKRAHYHIVLLLPAHDLKTAGLPSIEGTLANRINMLWENLTGGSITHTESFKVMSEDSDKKKAVFYLSTYLSKARGKEAAKRKSSKTKGVRSFGCSVLPKSKAGGKHELPCC